MKNLLEGWLAAVIKSARPGVGRGVRFPSFGIAQNEGLILRNVLIVEATESPILMRGVVVRTDKGLHFGTLEEAVDVVIVPQEIWRELRVVLLLPVLRRESGNCLWL